MTDNAETSGPYPDVTPNADYPAIERGVLERWAADHTFERSVEQRPADDEYVFYDGPPFANGLPHYGHFLTGYVKDVVPRYQTMRGHRVDRRFGWDCHGLPAEMEAEQELGVSGRRQIKDYGIDALQRPLPDVGAAVHARSGSSTSPAWPAGSTSRTTTRRWTSPTWRASSGRSSSCGTRASSTRRTGSCRTRGARRRRCRTSRSASTTPPGPARTRPSPSPFRLDARRRRPRAAVDPGLDDHAVDAAVQPGRSPSAADIDYVVLKDPDSDEHYVLGAATLDKYEGAGRRLRARGHPHRRTTWPSARYEPLFPYFADHAEQLPGPRRRLRRRPTRAPGSSTWPPASARTTSGSARPPASSWSCPVDDAGRFTAEVPDWAGENVFDANPEIIRHLKEKGVVVRHDTYDHNYPHCWRTDTPIIYKAVDSWYVEVTAFRDRLVELNQEINWIPDHVRDGAFGRWLEGARDWSISRNRFWGSPIPVWQSDDPAYPRTDVYGSLDEIEADFGVRPDDLHRPTVDDLVRPNPDDPTGQVDDAPRPRGARLLVRLGLDALRPGPLPVREPGVVRGPLPRRLHRRVHRPDPGLVLHTARAVDGAVRPAAVPERDLPRVVLAEDGRKLSKRLRNYPEPDLVFKTHGADALRWYFMSSPILRGLDLQIDKEGTKIADVVRTVLHPLWIAYHFFTLYANVDGHRATVPHRRHRHPRPLHPGQDPRPGRPHHRGHGRLRHRRGLRRGPGLPRGR